MTNEEAKFILQGYRSNGADGDDATFRAALAQARLDPALGAWLAHQKSLDAAISAKLAEIPAPSGLREAILAGGRLTVPDPSRRNWWRLPPYTAVAAGVALLLAVGLALWPKGGAASMPLAEFVMDDALHSENHGGHGQEAGTLQAVFGEPGRSLGRGLPVNFAALRNAGCRTIGFGGCDVLEVCFKRDGAWYHCYIVQRADFPSVIRAGERAFLEKNGLSLAAWSDDAHVYLLAGKAGRAALQRLL